MQAGAHHHRRRRGAWAEHLARHLPLAQQLQQHGGSLALTAAAVLGWALYLLERKKGRRGAERRRSSPGKEARTTPISHRLRSALEMASEEELLTVAAAAAAANAGAAPSGAEPAVERAEWRQALVAQLEQLRETASSCLPDSGATSGHVSAALLLVREEVQLLDLASELEALRAQLNQEVVEQARTALSADCSTAPSRTCSQTIVHQVPAAAAGDEGAACPGLSQIHGQHQHASEDCASSSTERGGARLAAFQQRLTPLSLRPGGSHPDAPPASPLLHASPQPNPGQAAAEQERWLSDAGSSAAEQQQQQDSRAQDSGAAAAAAAAERMLDDMLLASPVPAAPAGLGPPQPGASSCSQGEQPEQWSPKATVASLASLRHSAPALVVPRLHGTPAGSSLGLRSRSGPPGMAGTPAAQLGRMLRQSASLGSKQLDSSLASFQELAAARKAAAAAAVASTAAEGSTGLIPACYSTASTPASTRPNSACPRPGDATPGSGSRIPRGPRGWSPAATPGSSRIPRPST